MTEETSTYGKGFTYCIALFLGHKDRPAYDGMKEFMDKQPKSMGNYWFMWFNAAADHLYEMEIPEELPAKLKRDIRKWRGKCLGWRLDTTVNKHNFNYAIRKAKEFLMEIDRRMGVEPMQGEYE